MKIHATSVGRLGVIIGGGALLIAAGGGATLALASYSGVTSTGQVLSCMNTSTHTLRIVDHAACHAGETVLSWSQKGPAGAKGAPGTAGVSGPAGPAGAKGDTGATGAPGGKGDVGATGATGATGPAGPTGSTGPQGTPGTQGLQGPAGLVGRTVVGVYFDVAGGTHMLADVPCPNGTAPVGGGAHVGNTFTGSGDARYSYVSESSIDDSQSGWASTLVVAAGQGTTQFTAVAICVNG